MHMQVDGLGLIITAPENRHETNIKIISACSGNSPVVESEFNYHYNPVTALYLRNSLAISADLAG